MEKTSGIYQILCTTSGKRYIGSSYKIQSRLKEHIYDLRNGFHINSRLTLEWETQGEENFDCSILEIVDDKNLLFEREQFWIDTLRPELNIARDASRPALGTKLSEKTLRKLSLSQKKRHSKYSKAKKDYIAENIRAGRQKWWDSLTEEQQKEHIRKISNPHKPETLKILSEKLKGKPCFWKGKKRSAETSEKLRIAKQAEWDRTKEERKIKKSEAQAIFDAGREEREMERRRKVSEAMSSRTVSAETREKNRQIALTQQQDPEYKAKHQAGTLAAMQNPEVLQRLRDSHKGKTLSEEHRKKIGAANIGRVRSEETNRKQAESMKKRWAERKRKKEEEANK